MALTSNYQSEHSDIPLLQQALLHKTREYLKEKILEGMKDDIEQIAGEAVAKWHEVKVSHDHSMDPYGGANIYVSLVEHVVRTEIKTNPVQITVTKKDPK
jgi:hypothetical protein